MTVFLNVFVMVFILSPKVTVWWAGHQPSCCLEIVALLSGGCGPPPLPTRRRTDHHCQLFPAMKFCSTTDLKPDHRLKPLRPWAKINFVILCISSIMSSQQQTDTRIKNFGVWRGHTDLCVLCGAGSPTWCCEVHRWLCPLALEGWNHQVFSYASLRML